MGSGSDRTQRLLTWRREALRVLLQALQRCRAACWHGGTMGLVVDTASLADRGYLRLRWLLGLGRRRRGCLVGRWGRVVRRRIVTVARGCVSGRRCRSTCRGV